MVRLIVFMLMVSAASSASAGAGASIAIPEPGDAALFIVAVVGLIVGRHVSRRPPRDGG